MIINPIIKSTGGLKPEIIVTAQAEATLNLHLQGSAIILQTYTLGASETTHTFVVDASATAYVITDVTNSKDSDAVLVSAVEQYAVEIKYLPSPLLYVGGRIFYIHSDNGVTYRFFDSGYNEITDITVGGLANAYWYWRSGTPSADKFYVYDNTSHTYSEVAITSGLSANSIRWGYYGTRISVTTNSIGSGKTNTQAVLNMGVPTDYTPNIWGYIKDCRDNSLNGCNDWFIASMAEQNQLRSSGLVNWYSSSYEIWSSVELNSSYAYYQYASSWNSRGKIYKECCFAARSF